MKTALKSWLALALAAQLAACGSSEESVQPVQRPVGPVLVLHETAAAQWVPVSAQIATVDQAAVLARIPGILTSLSVQEGDPVSRGQVIGRIVDSQLAYQSGAYGAQAAAAQAQAAQAQAELDRVRFLYDNGVYAKARLEQAQAGASAAQAQVRAAQQQQRAVNAVAGQGAVVAPGAGRVLTLDIPAGSPVVPGMTIATVTSGPLILRLELPESVAGDVRRGSGVLIEGTDRTPELRGTVSRVYPAVAGGQVRADAIVPGLDPSLIGRRVSARVESGQRSALTVPQSYVTTRFGIDYVTVVAKDGSAATVPVQTAPSPEAGKVEILSGVSAGDQLVAGDAK